MAATPARFTGIVATSLKYMATGSLLFAPIGKATVGVVGETNTSTDEKALAKSCVINVRTF